MSVNGIPNMNPLAIHAPLSRTETRTDASRSGGVGRPDASPLGGQQTRAATASLRTQQPVAGNAAATQGTVPAEAPSGTDPMLWSVLTSEERNFFAKTASLGPLTYSRIKEATQPAPPAARGIRLDVRA